MLSTSRYDPTASADTPVAAEESNDALKSIKERIARNQAKRDAENKNVHFEEPAVTAEELVTPAIEGDASLPKSILKDTPVIPQEPKAKTKAKQKYLKRKLDRKKSAKKQAVLGAGGKAVEGDDAEEAEDKLPETPEEKAERKRLLKESRRAKRAQEAASASTSAPLEEPIPAPVAVSEFPIAEEPPKKKRKKESLPAPIVEEPITISAGDAKALKKAAKAAEKSRRIAAHVPPKPEVETVQPDHPNALPRFPRPAKLAAPDKSLLAQLSVAEELQGGLRVNPSTTIKVRTGIQLVRNEG